ncbi:competence/damage-inducible protein A [Halorientalis pallida]|uniref:Competence/damage-inducible protein A n=1 Tax=Halorientalis pallida TaxID=2479928 RepID=A0A498L4B0_9EURY|nr:molybdopterin-binding protein [Halorientalis pallida]RXK51464.1 competence/damage-inducible protein A [Halorientalis pallida]
MRVALVTVGDELLAGDTVNTNAAWLGERLTERGATVERVTVVPDRIGEIARVVNEYRAEYDAVVVTGGLGPTHDDVTMDGVAAAFGREVARSEEALAWLESEGGYAREDLAEGTADIPAGAEMLPNREGVAPGCALESVYVLPGVPAEMKTMFEDVADRFSGERRHVETVEADEPESALLTRVQDVRERFDVKVGSYPGETVEIKLESTDEAVVREAAAWLAERVETPETE